MELILPIVTVRDLYKGEGAESRAEKVDSRRIAIETITLAVSVFTLLASVFGQAPRWFQWVATAFAAVVGLWAASQLLSRVRAVWADYREGAALARTVRVLHSEFLDLLAGFNRYADNTRSDSIPRFLIQLVMEEKVDLPIADTSVYHIWRLYGILGERVVPVADAPDFKSLTQEFGEILYLYHSLYVLKPYEELRSTDISKLSPYAQTRVREELPVLREDYNDFIRLSNSFGERVNEAFGGDVFPAYLERLKPPAG